MALLLFIDTAMETARVGLGTSSEILMSKTNADQKNHAGFVQTAIQKIMTETKTSFNDIEAVAVVNGPGSYTGLRVGLSSAKGICYAAGKPLVLLNTLAVMASAAILSIQDAEALYCPMIDARRMEVFTALYTSAFEEVMEPQPMIIDENSFINILKNKKVYFFGSGHNKCGSLIQHKSAVFTQIYYTHEHINKLAQTQYIQKQFTDVAYAEPFYVKSFYMQGR